MAPLRINYLRSTHKHDLSPHPCVFLAFCFSALQEENSRVRTVVITNSPALASPLHYSRVTPESRQLYKASLKLAYIPKVNKNSLEEWHR